MNPDELHKLVQKELEEHKEKLKDADLAHGFKMYQSCPSGSWQAMQSAIKQRSKLWELRMSPNLATLQALFDTYMSVAKSYFDKKGESK